MSEDRGFVSPDGEENYSRASQERERRRRSYEGFEGMNYEQVRQPYAQFPGGGHAPASREQDGISETDNC